MNNTGRLLGGISAFENVWGQHENPHRAVVASDFFRLSELSEDSLGQNLTEFDTHLV